MTDKTLSKEHPFAPMFVFWEQGKTGSRNLTREEARYAMLMILRKEVDPERC